MASGVGPQHLSTKNLISFIKMAKSKRRYAKTNPGVDFKNLDKMSKGDLISLARTGKQKETWKQIKEMN